MAKEDFPEDSLWGWDLSQEPSLTLEKSITVIRSMHSHKSRSSDDISLLVGQRENNEVRSKQSLDLAGADGHREVGEVWGGTSWGQTGVASPSQARGTVLEGGKTKDEKKLDLGVFYRWLWRLSFELSSVYFLDSGGPGSYEARVGHKIFTVFHNPTSWASRAQNSTSIPCL